MRWPPGKVRLRRKDLLAAKTAAKSTMSSSRRNSQPKSRSRTCPVCRKGSVVDVVEDVVRAGLRLLETEEQKLTTLRAALEEGESSGIVEGNAFDRVRGQLGLK